MNKKYVAVSIRERYLAYLLDFVVIVSIAGVIAAGFGAGPVASKVCSYYLFGEHKILKELSSKAGIKFLVTYFVFAFFYFLYEGYTGISVGKLVLRMRTGIAGDEKRHKRCIIRAFIKTLPPVLLADVLFAFKKRTKQRLSDRVLNFLVVREKEVRIKWWNYLVYTMILYYLPIVSTVIIAYFAPWGRITSPPAPGSMGDVTGSETQFNFIFMNNMSIDYQYYILGGFMLFFNTLIQIFGGALMTGKILGDTLLTHPSFVVYGILPHFFIETMGYVFGLMSGAYITLLLLSLVEGYFERKDARYVGDTILWHLKRVIMYAMISIILLIVGAYVETYGTSYLLSHFY